MTKRVYTHSIFYVFVQEIRIYLFSDNVMEQDESTEPEIPPQQQHNLSGMGGGEYSGKYDGFGNSPIHKGNLRLKCVT